MLRISPLLNYVGSQAVLQGIVEAAEALQGFLDEHPELELAEFDAGENMPVTAVLSSEYSHDTYVWAPAGWVKA